MSASVAQISANQINAQKSTGPVTEITAIKLSICHFKSTVFSVAYGS